MASLRLLARWWGSGLALDVAGAAVPSLFKLCQLEDQAEGEFSVVNLKGHTFILNEFINVSISYSQFLVT